MPGEPSPGDGLMPPPRHGGAEDDGAGPRGRTLIIFGVCLGLMIVSIIVAAAVIAA